MRVVTAVLPPIIVVLLSPASLLAQSAQPAGSNASVSMPRLMKVTGVFQPADGQPPATVEVVTLSIYAEPEGGVPLWQEVQTVVLDKAGRYTVLLGASRPDGLPPEVFGSGQAQWMSVKFARDGEVEPPRVRIASVPYAFKALDATTLGGRPASDFVLAPTAGTADAALPAPPKVPPHPTKAPVTTAVLPGATNFLAKYLNSVDVSSSAVYETGGAVGIGTTTPVERLHLQFTNTTGSKTGLAVQNLGNTATSYSGMLFYDQFGVLGQFQGFNNATHEYRINNIAQASGQYNGSINFMIGSTSRMKVDTNGVSALNTIANGIGVLASAPTGYGVVGSTDSVFGVTGLAQTNGAGVAGSTDTGAGIFGATTAGNGWAGLFDGDVNVTGFLIKGGGAFRIDHPLDPENKYLSHSFVESPDMKNIYDGVAVLNGAGEAIVTLPDWFEALNEEFRYQLTPMGAAFVPYVAEEIAGNQFKIGGGIPGRKVSWQVTGIRHDAFANAHRIQVEEMKPAAAAGTYLHPEAFGQPVEKGRSTTIAADSKATPKDQTAERVEEMKARLRAIGQKPAGSDTPR
jgi:hypothetical protein